MSICNRRKSWNSLLALSLFQRVMNPRSDVGQNLGRGVTRLHVAPVKIRVRVWEMCGCHRYVIGHQSVEIGAIMIVLTRLRDGDTIESDVTLTEQRVRGFIGHARGVRKVHILSPRPRSIFPWPRVSYLYHIPQLTIPSLWSQPHCCCHVHATS